MVNNIIEIVSLITVLAPFGLKIFIILNQKSRSIKMQNLANRAEIIVTALDQSGLSNDQKQQLAFRKLSYYAKEVGIKVTPDQVEDYIESAVNFLRLATVETENSLEGAEMYGQGEEAERPDGETS